MKKMKEENKNRRHSKSKSINLSNPSISETQKIMFNLDTLSNTTNFETSEDSDSFKQFSKRFMNVTISPKRSQTFMNLSPSTQRERSLSNTNETPKRKKAPFIKPQKKSGIYDTSPTVLESQTYNDFSPPQLKKKNLSAENIEKPSFQDSFSLDSSNLNNSITDSNSIYESDKDFDLGNKENSSSLSIVPPISTNSNAVAATCKNCNKEIPLESVSSHNCEHISLKTFSKRFSMNRGLINQFRINRDK